MTSKANEIVCHSAELSALDRKLSTDYQNTLHQGNIDSQQLQAEEWQWLRDTRNRCATEDCLKQAYVNRDQALLDRSLQAASPAIYADTRAFSVPSTALSSARAYLGTNCSIGLTQPLRGTSTIQNFRIITALGGYVVPLSVDGYPFAFWFAKPSVEEAECTVDDVVALPATALGNHFLQCHLGAESHGFAIRSSTGQTLAYWSISGHPARFERQPIHVLGEQGLRCQSPETGE